MCHKMSLWLRFSFLTDSIQRINMNALKAAEKFAKKNTAKGKRSKLDPHLEAIQFLLERDYTLLQVQEFLANDLKLSVSYSNLQGWVKRRFNNSSSTVKVSSGNSQAQEQSETINTDTNPVPRDSNTSPFETMMKNNDTDSPTSFK